MSNDGVVVPAPLDGGAAFANDNRGAAAARGGAGGGGGGGGGGFPDLRNNRFRAGIFFAAWGTAGIMRATVPSLSVNADHLMFYFLLLMAGVLLLLLSMAAADLRFTWLETAAARLEGLLEDML